MGRTGRCPQLDRELVRRLQRELLSAAWPPKCARNDCQRQVACPDIVGGVVIDRDSCPLRYRLPRIRASAVRLSKGNQLRVPDGAATAGATKSRIRPSAARRISSTTTRAGWSLSPACSMDSQRASRATTSRQHHYQLADEHRDFWRPSLLGILGQGVISMPKASQSRLP